MRISVLIPTWRRPDDLPRCLAALDAQSRPPDEVLVIVRDGDRKSRDALERSSPSSFAVRRVDVHEPGVVAALRAGLVAASGDVIAVTDDDAAPRPEWLERLAAHYAAGERIGAVGGRDVLEGRPPGRPGLPVGRVRWFGRVEGNHHLGCGVAREVDVLKGVNLSFRAHAAREDDFDDGLRGTGAQVHWELVLCLGLRRRGWTVVYDPAVLVDHFPAPRQGADQRGGRKLTALADEVHNETYALLRGLPAWQAPLAFAYGIVVGSRKKPGLLTYLERLPREPDRRELSLRLRASLRARVEALRTRLRRRPEGGPGGFPAPRS